LDSLKNVVRPKGLKGFTCASSSNPQGERW
jgi:hypothetical protein